MNQLEIHNLAKFYGTKKVLKDISFTVRDGEFVSILGPSGSGKSTLFQMIGGITKPSSGTIYLNGKNINGKRGHISYTPQSASLLPWRTVLENVVLGQEIAGKKDLEKARKMIKRAGLEGFEEAYPHELSGGMKQRVSFIRSMMSPQSLILLDEPFSALDEFTRLDMQQWLLSIWEEHKKSILFVTHNIEEALFLSDRIIVFSSSPTTIKQEFSLPFPRPRDRKILLTDEFLHWKRKIYQSLSGDESEQLSK
ncbi:ABC transporter ATP-binding protein [Compostibacillus humi]|uniref:ABC transporter ATP-binding protein n=1 Tax=Compostibacillus humi TaxID=1245525 RepID=A0A8J2XES6_9BACI|nr:ABC transporter ATP-binding protein [Compostibacillus humi]GFZ75633.1 ABC transporter ATP-binding protein [Compostibacillus humi]